MTDDKRSFIVHAFVPVAEVSWILRTGWPAVCDAYDLTEPVGDQSRQDEMPHSGLVCARFNPETNDQAFIHRWHDLLYVSVAVAVADDWEPVERRWTEIIGGLGASAIGETRILLSYQDSARSVTVDEISDVPVDDRALRRLLVTAPSARARDTERWLWQESRSAPAPFARYLAQAAKVRYQLRLHGRAPDRPDVSAALDHALALIDRDPADAGLLIKERGRLLALTMGTNGLTEQIIARQEMRHTIRIAVANMTAERTRRRIRTTCRVHTDDLAVADWFADLLDDTIRYLSLDRERLRDVVSALTTQAEAAVQRDRERLQAREISLQRRREHVDLLQAAMIGAILMILAATQTFEYKPTFLPAPAIPALIALLGALSLWLATLVLSTGDGGSGLIFLGAGFAGLLAAASGWLISTLAAEFISGHPAASPVTWAVAVPAFAAGFVVMWRAGRSRHRVAHPDREV